MAHDTMSQDMKKLEGALATANKEQAQWNDKMARMFEQQGQQQLSSDTRLLRLEELISGISLQQNTLLQKLQLPTGETSSNQEHPRNSQEGMIGRNDWQYGGHYKFHKPKRDFPAFEGEDVHKWLYKCNQYFEIEEVPDAEKLKLASYYLDDMALYWHQNFMRSNGGRVVGWNEYVEAICGRFGGHKDPLEELKDLKQEGDLETYIKDFDILWNRAEIDERYALIFFLGGLETEIKNLVKMFEPKSLKQAYNLSRLQVNTNLYKKFQKHSTKHPTIPVNNNNRTAQPPPFYKTYSPHDTPPSKLPGLLPTPQTPVTPQLTRRPTRTLRSTKMKERRAKGLCFWCDDKFTPGHKCRTKRLYSICLVGDEDENEDSALESVREMEESEDMDPHISMNALEGVPGCYTLKVTGRVHKLPIFILVDSGSTHNFMNTEVANKLQCKQTPINPVTIKAANGGKMLCSSICKNFSWKMQGIYFVTDVFVMDLDACDMVLGVQWLATLGDIVCNYKSMWMSFDWQEQRVTLKGNEPVRLQSVQYG